MYTYTYVDWCMPVYPYVCHHGRLTAHTTLDYTTCFRGRIMAVFACCYDCVGLMRVREGCVACTNHFEFCVGARYAFIALIILFMIIRFIRTIADLIVNSCLYDCIKSPKQDHEGDSKLENPGEYTNKRHISASVAVFTSS